MTDRVQQALADLPDAPGCYRFLDSGKHVLYVGKATSLRSRVRSYFHIGGPRGRSAWIDRMMPRIADIETMVTKSPVEALLLELNLIRQHKPPYNTRLMDDKHYPYICLTWSEDYPRLVIVRRAVPGKDQYFGPYSSSRSMRRVVDTIRRIFGVRTCKTDLTEGSGKPATCLELDLGYCAGPCSGAVTREEYRDLMRQAARFLGGEVAPVVRDLERQMREASEGLKFERAAKLRDRLRAIEDTVQRQVAISADLTDRDVVGAKLPGDDGDTALLQVLFVRAGRLVDQQSFTVRQAGGRDLEEIVGEFLIHYYQRATFVPREVLVPAEPVDAEVLAEWLGRKRGARVAIHAPQRGEKRRLVALAMDNASHAARVAEEAAQAEEERGLARVAALQVALALPSPPNRVECYDISTLGGRESVGSMAVFIGGRPASGESRSFTVLAETPDSDDYAMMREVLGRRFARLRAGDAKFGDVPDLVLVDGGKGQLACAAKVMAEMGLELPIASLAKRREEVYVPGRSSPIVLHETNEGLKLLMHIRDQAHRLAITHHRGRRSRATTRSVLDDIPGIGPKRKHALLERFPSIRAICDATVDELAAVPGLDTRLAQEIHRRLRPVGSVAKHTPHRAPVPTREMRENAQDRED